MLHHLKHVHHVHHHVRRASKAMLVKAAEHHPILTTALVAIGGVSAYKWLTNKESTTSGHTVTPA